MDYNRLIQKINKLEYYYQNDLIRFLAKLFKDILKSIYIIVIGTIASNYPFFSFNRNKHC